MDFVFNALGGLGLFLLGMIVMTEGLRALAGSAPRRALARYTRSPLSGAVTGMTVTALVQSSSATTVAAIGFVSAGLLTFAQALGIIFGANIGTTITGWAVALFGFKLDLQLALLPVLFVGVLLRVFAPGRWKHAGMSLAGFGLIFVGIGFLQSGLAGVADTVTPASFPPDTLAGRALLVLMGIAITLMTQSSSAGVAVALGAVHAGAINFPQAAAMVIGMDVGTTVTALLASIGRGTPARRTGYAHVIYNCLTGLGAFLLLSPYTTALEAASAGITERESMFCLVGFHTLFNLVGVIVVLPFTRPFADWITRLVPERGATLTQALEERLLKDPGVALGGVVVTLELLARRLFAETSALLHGDLQTSRSKDRLDEIRSALHACRRYLALVRTQDEDLHARLAQAMHVLDHLRRAERRVRRAEILRTLREVSDFEVSRRRLREAVTAAHDAIRADDPASAVEGAEQLREDMRELRRAGRRDVMESASSGDLDPEAALERLDALRWLERVAQHTRRILEHLVAARGS